MESPRQGDDLLISGAAGEVRNRNRGVWDELYRTGAGVMDHPSEALIRLVRRRLDPDTHPRVLDLGFGSGNNLEFLARSGFECRGVEVSGPALEVTRARLERNGLEAELALVEGEEQLLPYGDGSLDAVICWLTLYYNDEAGVRATVAEMHRVLRAGGVLLTTLARPDDVLVRAAERREGGRTFEVTHRIPSQEGAVLFVPEDEAAVRGVFEAFRNVEIGHFEWSHGDTKSAHWMIMGERA